MTLILRSENMICISDHISGIKFIKIQVRICSETSKSEMDLFLLTVARRKTSMSRLTDVHCNTEVTLVQIITTLTARFKSKNVIIEVLSASEMELKHSEHVRTGMSSKPSLGMVVRESLHLSHSAFPHTRQWC